MDARRNAIEMILRGGATLCLEPHPQDIPRDAHLALEERHRGQVATRHHLPVSEVRKKVLRRRCCWLWAGPRVSRWAGEQTDDATENHGGRVGDGDGGRQI